MIFVSKFVISIIFPIDFLQSGPSNPFKSEKQKAQKNTLTGFVEPAHFNEFHFNRQIRRWENFCKIGKNGFEQKKTKNHKIQLEILY